MHDEAGSNAHGRRAAGGRGHCGTGAGCRRREGDHRQRAGDQRGDREGQNLAGFKQYVAADGWAIDPASGRGPISDFVKNFDAMVKDTKMSSWDITDDKVQWVDANTAVHTYKWTGNGTYKGQPIPSPAWASTVWTKKNGKWTAVFHHESLETPPAQK